MSDYRIKNTANVGKSYEGGNGKRIYFGPGEEKELSSLPPSVEEQDYEAAAGWEIELVRESKIEDIEHKGGE